MKIIQFKIDHREAPIDISTAPRFSWAMESDLSEVVQIAYELSVSNCGGTVWTSGRVASERCVSIPYGGALRPYERYEVRLTVWARGKRPDTAEDAQEETTSTALFETGKLNTPWEAAFITGAGDLDDDGTVPPYLFQKKVVAQKPVARARMYVTALGCFTVQVDGHDVSEEYFAPGYSQYTKRLLYKTYDATALFAAGEHTVCAEVSGGWYAGRLGLTLNRNKFGPKRAFLMELHLWYEDGSHQVVCTDGSWQVTTDGFRRFADFFDGEVYDARREELPAWAWTPARIYSGPVPTLEAYDGTPVIRHEELRPVKTLQDPSGKVILDFGRNFAGVISIRDLEMGAGRELEFRHGEVLNADSSLYTGNLRTAKAEIRYTTKDGVQSYTPRFTYMGFRYVEVSGSGLSPEELERIGSHVTAFELYSDMRRIGRFSCSEPYLNQLHENIVTSQKANFMDIPTDCPQRDERCGWTGDIAMFAGTAAFQMDTSVFLRKWLRDVTLAQRDNGAIPEIVPDNNMCSMKMDGFHGMLMNTGFAAWGDATTMVPWALYQATGDLSYLENQYESMKSWVEYELKASRKLSVGQNRYIWDKSLQYGDWLAPGEGTVDGIKKGKYVATAYMAHSMRILIDSARLLGKTADAEKYEAEQKKVKAAYRKTFVKPDGHLAADFQSMYVLGIAFDLLNDAEKELALRDLAANIRAHGDHIGTGFVGTPFLEFVLCDHGEKDLAYKLLLQETAPGWIYPIKCGATSMWERWDALQEDGTVKDGGGKDMNMVSFNHYAYGAVGDFLYRRIGGLEPVEPGYKKFRVAPVIGGGLTGARVSQESPYGFIEVSWCVKNGETEIDVTVPCNTSAEIVMNGEKKHCNSGKYSFRYKTN